jgi:hypothetical protein
MGDPDPNADTRSRRISVWAANDTSQTREKHWRARLDHKSALVVAALRDLADSVEQEAERSARVGMPGVPNYATVAHNVQHVVLWGLANLSLAGLTTIAYEADQERIQAAGRART